MADYKKSSVHCHSTMCDGKNTLQDMASAACAQGLTTLGFTGHSYTQRDREYCMSPSRTAQYKATIAKLKTEYKGKVDIHLALVLGLELGNGGLVLGGAAGAHAVFAVALGVAMAGEAQRGQALRTRSTCHILQGIFAIAHGGVAMDTGLLIICHR